MRSFIAFLILILAPVTTSHANDVSHLEQLALDIMIEAEKRSSFNRLTPAAPAKSLAIDDVLITQLSEFALAAHQLSTRIAAQQGPQDLTCIFKGMSRDVGMRITALDEAKTRADMARAYLDIAYLTRQASVIAADQDIQALNILPPDCDLDG